MRTADSSHAPGPAAPAAKPTLRPNDLYYLFLRQKWPILLFSFLGLASGAGLYLGLKPKFVSEALLYVRFVIDNRSIAADDAGTVRSPSVRDDTIISSEEQMLTSLDLAKEVVLAVGPTNVVGEARGDEALGLAIQKVRKALSVDVLPGSVIRLTFRHEDPSVARNVLTNLVDSYFRMHARMHGSSSALDEAAKRVDQRRMQKEQTEDQIRRLREQLGAVSIEDAKTAAQKAIDGLRDEIRQTRARLAELKLDGGLPAAAPEATATNGLASTTNATPMAQVAEYRGILEELARVNRQKQDLLLQFTEESPFLNAFSSRIRALENRRAALEAESPGVAAAASLSVGAGKPGSATMGDTLSSLNPALTARTLESRLGILTSQLQDLQNEAKKVIDLEPKIRALEHKLEVDTTQWAEASSRLDRARIEEDLSPWKLGNIRIVESPTPPVPDFGKRLKMVAALVFGGLVAGFGVAFGLEMYVDQTVRRPIQIEQQLRMPLYVSIPRLRLNHAYLPALPGPGESGNGTAAAAAPHEAKTPDEMATYAEALRDRIMMQFHLQGLVHKPKLVGVTACGHGAGVTTLATRLAATLSETGDGNVLYLNVNAKHGPSAHPYHKGELLPGVRDALAEDTRGTAKVQDNLYMAGLIDSGSGKVGIIPKTLSALVPRMKASDYDYIIFDLPPITQTSATGRIAGLLDMTVLVLDSEKTQLDLAKKAMALLGESRANVSAVLNKHRRYLPRRLDTDL